MNSSSDDRHIRLQSLFPDRAPPPEAWQRLSTHLRAETERAWVSPPTVMASVAVLVAGIVVALLVHPGKEDFTLEGVTRDPGGSRLFILTDDGRQQVPAERYADLTIYDLDAVRASPDSDGDNGGTPPHDAR